MFARVLMTNAMREAFEKAYIPKHNRNRTHSFVLNSLGRGAGQKSVPDRNFHLTKRTFDKLRDNGYAVSEF